MRAHITCIYLKINIIVTDAQAKIPGLGLSPFRSPDLSARKDGWGADHCRAPLLGAP